MKVGVNQVVSHNADDSTPEQAIDSLKSLRQDTLESCSGDNVRHVQGCQPKGDQISPPLKVGTIK
jgi:hypothetical protein